MKPFVKDGDAIAFIIGRTVLTTAGLREKVRGLTLMLRRPAEGPTAPAIVYIPDTPHLLATLLALLEEGICCIPVDPSDPHTDIPALAEQLQTKNLITTKQYAGRFAAFSVALVDEPSSGCALSRPGTDDHICEDLYIFPGGPDGPHAANRMDRESLIRLFETFDAYFDPSDGEGLFLCKSLSYPQLILASMWASSRGISAVIDRVTRRAEKEFDRKVHGDRKIEFGLFHFGSYTEHACTSGYADLLQTVRYADDHGFACVWTPERHFNAFGGLFPNPSVLSAAIAVTTSRVQIRCGSIVSPLHHAVRIAEDWSLIDNLSGGRVAISFASGWQCDDFILAPEHYASRHEHMIRQIDIVRRLWKGEKVPFKNGLGKAIEIGIYPRPVQDELPVWITVSGRTQTFIDAGRVGANILTHLLWQDTEELIDKIATYRSALLDSGFDPRSRKVSVMVHTYIGNDITKVREKVRGPLSAYIRNSTQLIQAMTRSNSTTGNAKDVVGRYGDLDDNIPDHLLDEMASRAFDRFFDQAGLLGDLAKTKQMIRKLRSYDIDEIACLIDFGLSQEDVMDGLDHLTELKEAYQPDPGMEIPVTMIYCSREAFDERYADREVHDLFSSKRKVLVETGNGDIVLSDRLDDSVRTKHPHPSGDLFRAPISEDF